MYSSILVLTTSDIDFKYLVNDSWFVNYMYSTYNYDF